MFRVIMPYYKKYSSFIYEGDGEKIHLFNIDNKIFMVQLMLYFSTNDKLYK